MSGTENNAPAPRKRSKMRWLAWLLAGVIGGVIAFFTEPRVYRSSTSILIIPQRVPKRFVEPTVTASLNERLNVIQQQILSRTRLERTIHEFSLYERERRQMIMEDVVERMRSDITVDIARPRNEEDDVRSFSVSYAATEPRTAMRVTERIASSFVQENLEDRAQLAEQTDAFLKGQVEELARRLFESDLKLRDMKQRGLAISSFMAEHEVLLATYKQMVAHSEASRIAVNVERRQVGEQFKIIDGARLPEKPVSPRLFPYLALGALAGVASGIVFSLASFVWRRHRPRPAVAH